MNYTKNNRKYMHYGDFLNYMQFGCRAISRGQLALVVMNSQLQRKV